MVKKKYKIQVQESTTYPGAEICSDHNVIALMYKLQRRKKVHKPQANNSKWAVSKLKENEDIENYKNGIQQNLNNKETETTDTNQQW